MMGQRNGYPDHGCVHHLPFSNNQTKGDPDLWSPVNIFSMFPSLLFCNVRAFQRVIAFVAAAWCLRWTDNECLSKVKPKKRDSMTQICGKELAICRNVFRPLLDNVSIVCFLNLS